MLLVSVLLILGYHSYLLRSLLHRPLEPKSEPPAALQPEEQVNPYADADLKTEVFMNEDKTFGYQILLNGSPMIRQPNIPGLPGNAGFQDKPKAEKTAGLVLLKIRKNIMPPALSIRELDSLGVL